MILFKKLLEIDRNKKKKIKRNFYSFNKNKKVYFQNEIKNLAQENLFMLKRLIEKAPSINNVKLQQDYEKNQKYKNHICFYPSINFYSNTINQPIIESFNFNDDKNKNNINNIPSIYKTNAFQFNKGKSYFQNHILDSQFYKNAKRNLKLSKFNRTYGNRTEFEIICGNDSISRRSGSLDNGISCGSGSLTRTRTNIGGSNDSKNGDNNKNEKKKLEKKLLKLKNLNLYNF